MVESIRNLTSSFQSLSSGLSVRGKVSGNESIQNRNSERANQTLGSLNDAVSFSTLALKSLEKIADEADNVSQAGSDIVQDFASDIDKLKEDIQSLLEVLRRRAERADVARENLVSSGARLRDVDAASAIASSAEADISEVGLNSLQAHGGLVPERVAALLED